MVVSEESQAILLARHDSLRQQLEATQRDLRKEKEEVARLVKVCSVGEKSRFESDHKLRKCATSPSHVSCLTLLCMRAYRIKSEPLPLADVMSRPEETKDMIKRLQALQVKSIDTTP